MIIGSYPCCDGPLFLSMPDEAPCWGKGPCEHCGSMVWHWLSRIDPTSYTQEQFDAEFVVDEDLTQVRRKSDLGRTA